MGRGDAMAFVCGCCIPHLDAEDAFFVSPIGPSSYVGREGCRDHGVGAARGTSRSSFVLLKNERVDMESGWHSPYPQRHEDHSTQLSIGLIICLVVQIALFAPWQAANASAASAVASPTLPVGMKSGPTTPAIGSVLGEPSPAVASMTGSCAISAARDLGPGGSPDWSPSGDRLAYHAKDANSVYQLHTMRPDGSGDACLTCAPLPGAPRVDRHKVNPVWHPSGQFIVVQGEMDINPLALFHTNKLISELMVNGLWTNLYVTTPDGQQWYQLTDYSNSQTDGAMLAHFSADGNKMVWSHLVAPASETAPWGQWRMLIADFVTTNGVPRLENVRDITPTNGIFVEANGFSSDGRSVIFTGDMENTHDWGHDIWTLQLATGEIVNLTRSGYWDEHAQYSPGGDKIVYMSSQPYPFDIFKTELMLMAPDGAGQRQLTHFNVPGYPESVDEQSMPTRANWNPEGTALAVTLQFADRYPDTNMWILNFTGPCDG